MTFDTLNSPPPSKYLAILHNRVCQFAIAAIDDYAKDGEPGAV